MRAVVPWWSGDGHRQRQCAHHRPWSSASVKNFPYSPLLSPPYLRCSTFPLSPSPPRYSTPRCTSKILRAAGRRQTRQEESQNLISRDAPSPSSFSSQPPPPPPPPISHHRRDQNCKRTRRGEEEREGVLTVFAAWEDHAWPGWQTSRENPVSEMRLGSFLIRGTGGAWRSGVEAETRGYDALYKTRPPPITSGIGLLDRMCVTLHLVKRIYTMERGMLRREDF